MIAGLVLLILLIFGFDEGRRIIIRFIKYGIICLIIIAVIAVIVVIVGLIGLICLKK
jgi:hypothetical protein